ncbi:hypothetical protein ABZT06_33390 [Streptomyces sp. NPDC005483]|uniref:hypothetical protein n=1 Tax=Streptomyces sp. NPDC005483 TaxID=3154882 RepID=UPI0033AE3D1C
MSQNEASADAAPTQAELFAAHITQLQDAFWWHLDALLEVMEASLPEIEKLDSSDEASSTVTKLMSSLSGGSVEKVVAAFKKYHDGKNEESGKSLNFMAVMWEEVKAEPWGPTLMRYLHEALRRPPRLPILLQSTTVSAVSNFEVLLSGLAYQYYQTTPQALEATSREKEKEFSLKDLKEMASIDDAVDMAITRRVDELMFGSFGEWRKFFIDKMNLKFDDYAVDWEVLQEIFQRRHVIVHNGGRASKRYLRSVASRFSEGVREGDLLEVDQDYVLRATHELLTFGFLLSTAVGIKLAKSEREYFLARLHHFMYRNLVKGRNELVNKCASYGEEGTQNMNDELTFRVNRWIARQRLSDSSVQSEVENWDVRALSPRYKLAKHCLLGEKDAAMNVLQSLYAAGDIGFEDIIEWPLLEPLRGTSAYVSMTRNMEIPEGWHLSDLILYENPKSGTLHLRSCSLVRPDFKRRAADQVDASSVGLCKRCKPKLAQ